MTHHPTPPENQKEKATLSPTTANRAALDISIVELVRMLARKAAEQDFRQELLRHWHTQNSNNGRNA